MPDNYATSADGLLIVANGIDPVLRWDSYSSGMEPAGLIAPRTAPTLAFDLAGLGSITGDYYAFVRFVDNLGNVSNLSPLSVIQGVTGGTTVTYTAIPVPTEPKVVRRQILRNTSGQTAVFYVDVDTTDCTSTGPFTSTKDDSTLAAQTAVSLFDIDGRPLANAHGVPPSWKAVVTQHLDRMFFAGEVAYTQGSVSVTTGSTSVQGIGTEWPVGFGANRNIWINGADKAYPIAACNPTTQTLTLSQSYAGPTDPYADYSIRAPDSERRLVYYSESGQPESVPRDQCHLHPNRWRRNQRTDGQG
jgi:hypothetical protein